MIGIGIKKLGVNTESCSDVNGSQEFKCRCKDGFLGKRCEVSVCSSDNCNNNGLCLINENNNDQMKCVCNEGFGGETCEITLCDGGMCENGFCNAGECICNDGYVNIQSICVETCDLNPCQGSIQI